MCLVNDKNSLFVNDTSSHLFQEVAGEDEVGQELIVGRHNVLAFAPPFEISLMYEDY